MFPTKKEIKEYRIVDIISVVGMIVATVWTFSIDKALFVGFAVFIIGQLLSGKTKEINLYMMLSTLLLATGIFFSF